jgi:uncharacterized surface protein with fasciclin (FAS1) repeats
MTIEPKTLAAASFAAIAIAGLTACSGGESQSGPVASTTSVIATSYAMAPAATGPIGPGCADYAAQYPAGPASVTGMTRDPVATAASNNPLLSTLASALSGKLNPHVNLVSTLNDGEYTVFAPTNAAFDKLPPATIDKLKTDSALLTSILTYHVVLGQSSPDQVAGVHQTLQGSSVVVSGQGDDLKFDAAGLVCGGVHTANATVYMIDTVLTPPNIQ